MLKFDAMYFTALPDHSAPGFDEGAHFNQFRRHNVIFNARSSGASCDDHVGCLSLKTVLDGQESYRVDRRQIAVRSGQFLILNSEQRYGCHINPATGAWVLSLFFKKEFAAAVYSDILRTESASLENPDAIITQSPEFFQTLRPLQRPLAQALSTLLARLAHEADINDITDEYLIFLLRHLIRTQNSELSQVDLVDARRPSTRLELLRRLHLANDFMQSAYKEPLDLDVIGRTACLSVPQLVRQFKSVFGQTPHQYLTNIRLKHAADSLRRTLTPVRELTWQCGFTDPSAFCRIFRANYGLSPERYRTLHRRTS
jgi:AraC-like DNA-binding protein